ncbi:uncharacterized protein [Amphiura filiformis]|uniref:uncharacterized protein n=1 Tax=Amphiura filiformis TaxID=82378 RepID=UPI003B221D32
MISTVLHYYSISQQHYTYANKATQLISQAPMAKSTLRGCNLQCAVIWRFTFTIGLLLIEWKGNQLAAYAQSIENKDRMFVVDFGDGNTTDPGRIWYGIPGTTPFNLQQFPTTGAADGISYHPYIEINTYWTEVNLTPYGDGHSKIKRATFLNFDEADTIISEDLFWPTEIIVDTQAAALYWVNNDINGVGGGYADRPFHVCVIEKSDLDGKNRMQIVPPSHEMKLTFALAFNQYSRILFWCDTYNRKIEKMNVTEGYSSVSLVLDDPDEIRWLTGIEIDYIEQRLYFSDQGLQTLKSINFDGSDLITFYKAPTGQLATIFGIGIFGNDVYWADWEYTTLFRKNKYDGLQPQAVEVQSGEIILKRGLKIEFYQDDPEDTRCKPCCNEGLETGSVLRTTPSTGSMLGGEILRFSGACTMLETNLKCRFDHNDDLQVDGQLDGTDVLCVSPTLFKTGRILVEISFDGVVYGYQAYYTAVSPERFQSDPKVQRVDAEWSSMSFFYSITWNTSIFDGIVETVNIDVFAYTEPPTGPELTSILTLNQQPVDYSDESGVGSFLFISPPSPNQDYKVGIIKVYDSTTGSQNGPALWSDVHSLEWLKPRTDCGIWASNEMGNRGFHTSRPACPCKLEQVLVDFGRYTPLPACNMANSEDPNNCIREYTMAIHCVIARHPSNDGAGQECCYSGTDENIIAVNPIDDNNDFDEGGGFAHRSHSDGVAPYNAIGKVPFLSHFLNDLEPRLQCCVFETRLCYRYKQERPSQTVCNKYSEPKAGVGAGDPHFLTMDGYFYTFNPIAELIVIETDFVESERFILQARADILPNADFAVTVFTAFVAQYGFSDVIHVEVSLTRHLNVWVRGHQEEIWNKVNLGESEWWNLQGVSLYARNIVENGVLVLFDGGVSLQFKATGGENRAMSVIFLGPESFKGHTRGLLGTWNDAPDDDLLTRTGTFVPIDASTQDIHEQFGQTWQITDEESLFYYLPTRGPASYRDESFVPVYAPPLNEDILPEDVEAACNGNEWCIFDYLAIGDVEVATASRAAFEEQEALTEASMNVILCSSLTSPTNGNVFITRTSVGGLATYFCDEGYMLMGMERRVCQQTGQWFGRMPSCTEIPVIGPSSFSLSQSVHLVLENEGSIKVTIRRSGDTRIIGSVMLSTSADTALSTTDFQSHTELLTFDEGIGEIQRFIYIKNDDIREDLESFEIHLSDAVNSDIGMPDMATVFIEDDEVEHFFREFVYTASEITASVQLTVQKVGYMGRTEVNFLTMDGSAKSPEDYISRRGTVVFEQDFNTAYIEISIRNDDTYEESEQFSVVLQSSTPENIGSRDEAVVNIENDDELCSVPCENGGECTDVDTCTCSSPAFYGRYCEKDSCTPPCENGGKCTAFSTCDCAEGYQGSRCQSPVCVPTCANGGTCVGPNTCSCTPNYTGSTCTRTVCSPPCLNRGTCNAMHTCTCPFMFTGDQCELLATNDCLTPNLCGSEEFRCIETMANYMCRCAFGYFAVGGQCLLASRVIVAEISILEIDQMSMLYDDTLMYPGSREFAALEDTLLRVLSNILRFGVTGFLEVKIRAIRMGSIRVEFEVLLNRQTTSGSKDVLHAIQRSTTPRGILAGTNIKVDPFFTTIISELCPAKYCEDNMVCRPDPINSSSVCVCDDDVSEEECSQLINGDDDGKDDDDLSVAVIIVLGIILIVLLIAIPVGLLFCRRVRRNRQLNDQRVNMSSAYAYQHNQLPNVYWNAGASHIYTLPPQTGGTTHWGINSWGNYA